MRNMSSDERIRALLGVQDDVVKEFCYQIAALKRYLASCDPGFGAKFQDCLDRVKAEELSTHDLLHPEKPRSN